MKLFIAKIDDYGVFIFEAHSHEAAHNHVEDLLINVNIPFNAVQECISIANYRFEHDNHIEVTPFTNDSRRTLLLNSRDTLRTAVVRTELQAAKYGLSCPHHIKTEIDELRAQLAHVIKQLEELAL